MTEIKYGQSTGADLDANQVRQRNIAGATQANGSPHIQSEDLKKLQKVRVVASRDRRAYQAAEIKRDGTTKRLQHALGIWR